MEEIKREKQIFWINAVKLIACILVFVSHYFSSFYFLDASQAMSPGIYFVLGKFTAILNGTLWVMVFCFISGVFSANKKIGSFKSFVGESLYRYIRLTIPIFITGFFIFMLSQAGFLLNPLIGDVFHCSSYLDAYYQSKISFFDYIREAFTFGSILNPPLWMMGTLLDGNIIIFVCNYVSVKAKRNWVRIALYIFMALFCCTANKLYQAICLMGAIGSDYIQNGPSKKAGSKVLAFAASIILFTMAYIDALYEIPYTLSRILNLDFNEVKCFISACAFMILLNECAPVRKLLSANFINNISKYSYTIYLVHFPIICSLSIYLYRLLLPRMNYEFTFVLVFIITSLVVGIVTALYSKLFDNSTNRTMHFIREKIGLIEKKLPNF